MKFPTKIVALSALVTSAAAFPWSFQSEECSSQASGYGPAIPEDTPEAFEAHSEFSEAALSAVTPSGYVRSYAGQNATYNDPYMFVGYKEMSSYNVQECADVCDRTSACNAFTIVFERNPLQIPGPACPNPAGTTRIKCSLWTGTITKKMPMNHGQFQQKFRVVMAGANAYVKQVKFDTVPNIMGWKTETYKRDGAIQAPLDCHGKNTYLGLRSWKDGKFNATRCTDACSSTKDCHFANTYFLRDDDVPFAQHCSLYTAHWPVWYATNSGQVVGDNELEINATRSYGFTITPGNFEACEPMAQMPVDGLGS